MTTTAEQRVTDVDQLEIVRAGTVEYVEAWERQRQLQTARIAGTAPDTVLLLEHPAVYTAGKRTQPWERPVDGTPVVDVDRGGTITWHGPGQLVGYPIVKLPDPVDVVAWVRRLEGILIDVCARFGVETTRVEGRSGVWVPADDRGPARKIAAIGLRVSHGVSMHGFSLNCDPDMSAFDQIVPCGLRDATAASFTQELGRRITVPEALEITEAELRTQLSDYLYD